MRLAHAVQSSYRRPHLEQLVAMLSQPEGGAGGTPVLKNQQFASGGADTVVLIFKDDWAMGSVRLLMAERKNTPAYRSC